MTQHRSILGRTFWGAAPLAAALLATGGANSFRFTGRVDRKALKPGAYQLVATGPGGARTTAFRIIG